MDTGGFGSAERGNLWIKQLGLFDFSVLSVVYNLFSFPFSSFWIASVLHFDRFTISDLTL